MKSILVLGCGGSAGINFVKALRFAEEKFKIVGVDINKYYVELSDADIKYYLKRESVSDYVNKLNRIIKKEKLEFVHAQPDPEVKIISDNRSKLIAKTFLPSKDAVDISQDKWKTYRTLSKKDVPVAKTFFIENKKDLEKAFEEINGPVWIRASKGAGGKASLKVDNLEHAKAWIEYWTGRGLKWSDFLASEFLPGKEVSWLSLWKDGELICSQSKMRLEWMQTRLSPSGVTGTTAIQKTVHRDDVNEIATKTVLSLDPNPNGIFVVDVKENKNGVPCVTEINAGRFFTTSYFFPNCGVNFPHIYIKLAYDELIPEVAQYNAVPDGIYWIRVPDGGPVLIKNGEWSSRVI